MKRKQTEGRSGRQKEGRRKGEGGGWLEGERKKEGMDREHPP